MVAAQPTLWADAPPFAVAPNPQPTPVQRHGDYWFKRDDLYEFAGTYGGKVRTCRYLASLAQQLGMYGLVTAGSRSSPQVSIVARVAATLGLRASVYVPMAKDVTPEIEDALAHGAAVEYVKPGHNSVLIARARAHCQRNPGTYYIPFGMQDWAAVHQTCGEYLATAWPPYKTLHVPVGSGMTLAGVLWGRYLTHDAHPVLGWRVGADPTARLDRYAPRNWRSMCTLQTTPQPYDEEVYADLGFGQLDPVYEAKVAPYLGRGDLLWVVGKRATLGVPGVIRWRVSAAWVMKGLDCTYAGITGQAGCGAGCCHAPTYWPSNTGQDGCAMLTPSGCSYTPVERPVTCLLYPLRLNGSNTLVGHLAGFRPNGVCWPNYEKVKPAAPPLWLAMQPQLTELFGYDQWVRVWEDVERGKDSYVVVPPHVHAAILQEEDWEVTGALPQPRSGQA